MPRALAAKAYPSRFDVYTSTNAQDPDTGSNTTSWNYLTPETYDCNVASLRPQSNLETFGASYLDSEFIKIETNVDPSNFTLAQRVGNLRSKQGSHYYRTPAGKPLVFDVSGISPQIDATGRVVSVALYCRLASAQPTQVAQA